MFFGSIPIKQSPQNEFYRMLLVGQTIEAEFTLNKVVDSVIDVRHLFPKWILDRSEIASPSNYLVKFTQAYYDWLYNFSNYKLSTTTINKKFTTGIVELIDIDNTPIEFLKHFTYTYASGFPTWYIGSTGDGSSYRTYLTNTGIRKFIKNVRQSFYQKKSTESAYEYFFSSLFGSNASDVEFYYPKADILRLNGGKIDSWDVITEEGVTGHYGGAVEGEQTWHLGGSYLNGRYKIQDSNWYQEFSYVVNAQIDETDEDTGLPIYFDALQSMLHPAGMKGFWEKTEQDYIPPDDFDGGFNLREVPRLKNYFAYRMDDTASLPVCWGCSGSGFTHDGPTAMFNAIAEDDLGGLKGWTYGSGWDGIGAGGIILHGGDVAEGTDRGGYIQGAPVYNYPDWSDGISGDTSTQSEFSKIYIREFIYLSPLENSPNTGITGCTAYNDKPGGACYP
jgi:hypothetical protein